MESRNIPEFWASALPLWQSDNDDANNNDSRLLCCQIRQETADVKSFFFQPRKPSIFAFLPGQFITLELTIAGEIINRSYTISSAPSQPHVISITVKRKPDGIASNWLHDNLQVGMAVSVLGPMGDFTCVNHSVNHPASKYLFLSGGSGITPLMSMARSFYQLAEATDIAFVHSARTPADIIFKQELDLMASNQPLFQPSYLCAKVDKTPNWRLQPKYITEGFISLENLVLSAPDFLTREVFTCGPAPYMAAVKNMLKQAGFNMQHYHEESFSFDELPPEMQAEASAAEVSAEENNAAIGTVTTNEVSSTFSVELTKSGVTVQCAPDQFVLDAARAAGLRLPSSCSKGLCGTCKSKLVSGQVEMKHGGGIRQREIDQGLFLPCCAKPLSDLVIER